MITLGLVDDQPLFVEGISMIVSSQPDMQVRWMAHNGAEAIEKAAAQPVDIVLIDVQMPVLDGISATVELVAAHPSTSVVILTTFDDQDYVVNGLAAGASGFLLKDTEPETLLRSIRTVHQGEAIISPRATTRLISRLRTQSPVSAPGADDVKILERLTEREKEILIAIAHGWSNTEISQRMFITMATVKTHVGRILAKTGSRDRVHAVIFAYRTGLVDPHTQG
ncbi:response regulator [Corynebacterium cystitidis]|uniref:response regulator n=1 Tax=Corynebacterium cystitidis TaxID=35757 RepID=UPI00211E994E|nr:response regulator transcription factor [Corynebacterium cystitidis]